MTSNRRCLLTIPVRCESEHLPNLLSMLECQERPADEIHFCVNQPASWLEDPAYTQRSVDNQNCLALLDEWTSRLPLHIMDCASPGKAWPDNDTSVGKARKLIMDEAAENAKGHDMLICMDADTYYEPNYLAAIDEHFNAHPTHTGLSAPYYHHTPADPDQAWAMLYYECYMRYTFLNLTRLQTPFAFTALGSAMSMTVKAYKDVSGMPKREAAEDFYMLQKLAKQGPLGHHINSTVNPSSRPSYRTPFGTGKAVADPDPERYPLFDHTHFDRIRKTIDLFPILHEGDKETPIDDFLEELFGGRDIWSTLRQNVSTQKQFVRACHGRLDGLRILQFLKSRHKAALTDNQSRLNHWIDALPEIMPGLWQELNPQTQHTLSSYPSLSTVSDLSELRDALFECECIVRQA